MTKQLNYRKAFVNIALPLRAAFRHAGGAALILAAVLGGCATPPTDPADRAVWEQNNDPLEPINRKIFAVNMALDHAVFRPVAKAYVVVVPDDGRAAVHHLLDNLKEPTVFSTICCKARPRAGITLGRFLINSTVGFGTSMSRR